MVHWVEKASLEKIRLLLEISEQEHHYEVLLAPKNLADVRRNSPPYSVPIIPRSLPSENVDGEHFITADLLNLIASCGSSSRVLDAETSSQELVSRTLSRSSASTSGGSDFAQCGGERGYCSKSLPLPKKGDQFCPSGTKD